MRLKLGRFGKSIEFIDERDIDKPISRYTPSTRHLVDIGVLAEKEVIQ